MRAGFASTLPARTTALRQAGGDVLKSEDRAFVRVGEAAMILGISKSAAYGLANSWLATEGQAGLPAVRMGRCVLVPRAALKRLAAVGSDHDNLGRVRRSHVSDGVT